MSRYRKVHVKIWNDEKFRRFTDDGKLAFLFLLTHPAMTSLGAMRATPGGLAEELGWEVDRMAKALADPLLLGMLVYNRSASFVWIPNFLSYNPPENPNVVKSWADQTEMIPECNEKKKAIESARKVCEEFGEAFIKAFDEAFAKGMPNPEPQPLPEPLPKGSKTGDSAPRAPRFKKPSLEDVKAYITAQSYTVDAEKWFNYYTANGWRVGRNPMSDWKAAVRTWTSRRFDDSKVAGAAAPQKGKYDGISR